MTDNKIIEAQPISTDTSSNERSYKYNAFRLALRLAFVVSVTIGSLFMIIELIIGNPGFTPGFYDYLFTAVINTFFALLCLFLPTWGTIALIRFVLSR